MISLVQFGINKHLLIFSRTTNCTRPTGSCNLLVHKAFLMCVENVEMDNSLKCVLFIKVSGQITSATL